MLENITKPTPTDLPSVYTHGDNNPLSTNRVQMQDTLGVLILGLLSLLLFIALQRAQARTRKLLKELAELAISQVES